MAESTTAVYKFIKPDIGGSKVTWGNRLNKDLDDIDAFLAGQNDAQWYGLQRGDSAATVKQYDNAGNIIGSFDLMHDHFRTATKPLMYTQAMVESIGNTTEFFNKTKPELLLPQQYAFRLMDLLLPVGSIIMWAGTEANVPAGWRMCRPAVSNFHIEGGGVDDVMDIPDLAGRFIMAAYRSNEGPVSMRPKNASGTAGTFGHTHPSVVLGHKLTPEEIPPHRHDNTVDPDEHNFLQTTDLGQGTYDMAYGGGQKWLKAGLIGEDYKGSSSGPGGTDGAVSPHSHDMDNKTNTVPDSPWYALCYIIKVRRWETWVPDPPAPV